MIKNHVVNLKLASKLKEAGYPQGKSCFKWVGFYEIQCYTVEEQEYVIGNSNVKDDTLIEIDCPLATEIIKELPVKIIENNGNILYLDISKTDVAYTKYGDYVYSETEELNLQDNMAKMWLKLKKFKEDKYIN